MRTYLIGAAALAAVVLATDAARAQTDNVWRVGQISPTTGAAASIGAHQVTIFKWWVDEANRAGGIRGRQIELTICNDENNPEKAVACARDMLAKKPVMLMLATLTASVRAVMSLIPNGPVAIVASPNIVPTPDSFVFQTSPTPDDLNNAIADALLANGHRKFGMIAATDASGEVNVESANRIFPKRGIETVLQRIDLRATDASAQLARMAGGDIPLIYSTYSGRGAATVVKSYHNLGLEKPMLINFANTSQAFLAEIKDVMPKRLLGITFRAAVPELVKDPADRARANAFKAAYEKQFSGEHVDELAVLMQFQGDALGAVLRNVADPTDPKAVKQYLESAPIPGVQTLRWTAQNHVALGPTDTILVEQKGGVWAAADPLK
jgi:branched-chain amino acid transport system substrate-binding protein